MAVTKATLRTTSWDTVYTYLQTTDPISTDNIFSAMNSTLVKNKGYPIVIIAPPRISYIKLSLNGGITESNISMLISIYDDNSQDVKALADEVTDKLLAGRITAFASERLMRLNIDEGDDDTWEEGDKKIHRIEFSILFRYIA